MIRHQDNGLAYYTFASLDAFPEVVHGVTTRHGGVSEGPWASLNLTKGVGDAPEAVEENLRRVSAAFGFARGDLVSPNQRHTANVQQVRAHDRGRIFPDVDTLMTADAGVPMLLRYADCTPILLYDPVRRAAAVIHSGWRGTVQAAAAVAVGALAAQFGSAPADIVAAIGPSIGPCCYEVGDDVVDAVTAAFDRPAALLPRQGNGRRHFDLWAANRALLHDAGVRQIEAAEVCTACHPEEFFSYRGQRGRTGHFGALLALRENGS
ncbi:MAG: Laccase domain protein [Chloroflexi bacterium ADurb.Bin325]|nr:MAG: Laccase domain protein [Chloroflexi bacterium ADurb.Bin325]